MAQFEINSFFTINGAPANDLGTGESSGYPKIRIIENNNGVYTLLIGSPDGTIQNTDGVMDKIIVGSAPDGYYAFTFTELLGYDITKEYIIRVDGGSLVDVRYQTGNIIPAITDISQVGTQVWATAPGNAAGSAGEFLTSIKNNTTALMVSMTDVTELVDLCIKYQTNRTKIDMANKTLIVYDNDCDTILRTFKLLDSHGIPSVTEIAERVPIFATDDKPVC